MPKFDYPPPENYRIFRQPIAGVPGIGPDRMYYRWVLVGELRSGDLVRTWHEAALAAWIDAHK